MAYTPERSPVRIEGPRDIQFTHVDADFLSQGMERHRADVEDFVREGLGLLSFMGGVLGFIAKGLSQGRDGRGPF